MFEWANQDRGAFIECSRSDYILLKNRSQKGENLFFLYVPCFEIYMFVRVFEGSFFPPMFAMKPLRDLNRETCVCSAEFHIFFVCVYRTK